MYSLLEATVHGVTVVGSNLKTKNFLNITWSGPGLPLSTIYVLFSEFQTSTFQISTSTPTPRRTKIRTNLTFYSDHRIQKIHSNYHLLMRPTSSYAFTATASATTLDESRYLLFLPSTSLTSGWYHFRALSLTNSPNDQSSASNLFTSR